MSIRLVKELSNYCASTKTSTIAGVFPLAVRQYGASRPNLRHKYGEVTPR
jgi:hypothetical protein